jgi:hypothetical protein
MKAAMSHGGCQSPSPIGTWVGVRVRGFGYRASSPNPHPALRATFPRRGKECRCQSPSPTGTSRDLAGVSCLPSRLLGSRIRGVGVRVRGFGYRASSPNPHPALRATFPRRGKECTSMEYAT